MQARVDRSLIRARQGKHERKGLEAIFTSQNNVRNSEVLAGVAGVVAGLFLSIVAAFQAEDPQALGAWGQSIYSPLAFGSIGVLLLICGVGTIIFGLVHHETSLENRIAPSADEHSEVDSSRSDGSAKGRRWIFGPGSNLGSVAFIQSLVLVALYAGFVQEYESNLTLQNLGSFEFSRWTVRSELGERLDSVSLSVSYCSSIYLDDFSRVDNA